MKVDEEDRIRKEEAYNKTIKIAKGMKNKKIDLEIIIELTGLTKEEIDSL
jgi:hypothetical protein